MIRHVSPADFDRIAEIYNYYILHTIVTFEEEAVASRDIAERVREVGAASLPWLVAEEHGTVVGYAYAGKWRGRSAYRHSVEAAVYLDQSTTGRGLGTRLYESLFAILRRVSKHVIIGGIALPNPASVALHEKFGLEKVAHFKEVGFKFDKWIDVGYWQTCIVDTRS